MAEEQRPEEGQRWTAKRRAALVISLLKGETTAAEAARRHGLKVVEVEAWRDRFLLGTEKRLAFISSSHNCIPSLTSFGWAEMDPEI